MRQYLTERINTRVSAHMRDRLEQISEYMPGYSASDVTRVILAKFLSEYRGPVTAAEEIERNRVGSELVVSNFERDGDDGEWSIHFTSQVMRDRVDEFEIEYLPSGRPGCIRRKQKQEA